MTVPVQVLVVGFEAPSFSGEVLAQQFPRTEGRPDTNELPDDVSTD